MWDHCCARETVLKLMDSRDTGNKCPREIQNTTHKPNATSLTHYKVNTTDIEPHARNTPVLNKFTVGQTCHRRHVQYRKGIFLQRCKNVKTNKQKHKNCNDILHKVDHN